jgi:methylglutaconyl-CoA hydratase
MSKLIVRKENAFAHIILNNPEKHNAFDEQLIQDLLDILKKVDTDNSIRVVFLSALGPSFSAGADLQWMKKMALYSEEENFEDAMKLARLMQTLNQLSKPTIALVQGNAFGGALGLIACCDIALSAPQATFCFSEVKLGLIPAVISPYAIAAMGERAARRYFLTAERFSAQEALKTGLIHSISNNLLEDGLILAKQIAQNGPSAIHKIKMLTHKISRAISEDIIKYTAQAIAESRVSPEGQEGLSAFLEKRKPNWLL